MHARSALLTVLTLVVLPATPAQAAGAAWEQWRSIPGVFDVGGPRGDGSLIVAGSARLYLVDPAGTVTPFAAGTGGYADDPGAEAYFAVAPGPHPGAGCNFLKDDVFVLRLHAPLGITRVDQLGHASPFATVPGVQSLTGIAFDTTGDFGYRLLVSGGASGKTVIAAMDCAGGVQVITRSAPVMEGGLAVAPRSFGSFGGALIAPDELSGNIYAIAPNGSVSVVARSGLPIGGDIGVEGVGFVPNGLLAGGEVYYADRATPGNPHPGTDSLLRLKASELVTAGVSEGDLLAATEGGATMIGVHCEASCTVVTVVGTATTAHGEGHIAFTIAPPAPSPSPRPSAKPSASPVRQSGPGSVGIAATVLALVALMVGILLIRRRRPPKASA